MNPSSVSLRKAAPVTVFAVLACGAWAATPDLSTCDVWQLACHWTDSSREATYDINRVVIHKGEGATASGGSSWFANCNSGGSAHFFFDKANGYCYQCVREADVAWHAGNGSTNNNSVGIEHSGWTANNDTSTACYNESAIETRSCIIYYGVPWSRSYIIGHSEVPGCPTPGGGGTSCHTDPGRYWNWSYYMSQCNPNPPQPPPSIDIPIVGDWNGDGIATPGVQRGSMFYLRNSNSSGVADIVFQYGEPGDIPIVGDWNGDGIDTIGVYRGNTFYLRNSNTPGAADILFSFGNGGDKPIVGDWDGNGIDTIGVYRPSTAWWYLRNSNSAGPHDGSFSFGNPGGGDKPITGDWNHDGFDTVGIQRGSMWYLANSNIWVQADVSFQYGDLGDVPLAGDWNGDGFDTIGVRRSTSWYLRNSNSSGGADITFMYGD